MNTFFSKDLCNKILRNNRKETYKIIDRKYQRCLYKILLNRYLYTQSSGSDSGFKKNLLAVPTSRDYSLENTSLKQEVVDIKIFKNFVTMFSVLESNFSVQN